jgi:hypothetical protein
MARRVVTRVSLAKGMGRSMEIVVSSKSPGKGPGVQTFITPRIGPGPDLDQDFGKVHLLQGDARISHSGLPGVGKGRDDDQPPLSQTG